MNGDIVTLEINGQQIEFVERVRRGHFPDSTLEQMVHRALAEWGPTLVEAGAPGPSAPGDQR